MFKLIIVSLLISQVLLIRLSRHSMPITAIKHMKKLSHSQNHKAGGLSFKVDQIVGNDALDGTLKANKADVNFKLFGTGGLLSGICGSSTFMFTAGKTNVVASSTKCPGISLQTLIEEVISTGFNPTDAGKVAVGAKYDVKGKSGAQISLLRTA